MITELWRYAFISKYYAYIRYLKNIHVSQNVLEKLILHIFNSLDLICWTGEVSELKYFFSTYKSNFTWRVIQAEKIPNVISILFL